MPGSDYSFNLHSAAKPLDWRHLEMKRVVTGLALLNPGIGSGPCGGLTTAEGFQMLMKRMIKNVSVKI